MNSRIYQIATTPIETDDYIEEDKYYDNFVGEIADYISKVSYEDRSECINELTNQLVNTRAFIRTSKGGIKLVNKEKYLRPIYDKYIDALKRTLKAGYDDFEDPEGGDDFYDAKMTYSDRFGTYLDNNGDMFGLRTLNDAIRVLPEGTNLFFGSVFVYHY